MSPVAAFLRHPKGRFMQGNYSEITARACFKLLPSSPNSNRSQVFELNLVAVRVLNSREREHSVVEIESCAQHLRRNVLKYSRGAAFEAREVLTAFANFELLLLKFFGIFKLCPMMWRPIFLVVLLFVIGETQRRNFSAFPCPAKCYCFKRTVRCMRIELDQIPKTALQTSTL